ncbi:hypothetical protein [Marilutibacter chinensis]|uniref:Calcineurin-like phosphoesterase domain-containing protein n=1 Tax=Marilutibacter chinensis TaxID=2912247 RepID=A0ABS9HWH9_9GAMM|nr:hypothetical protein [Lysobacter chinensis]MCF7222515.1 hypothetical protein [Lysobacter chinensis]
MGLGRRDDGQWSRQEDFRWNAALAGFLDDVSRRHGDSVDLIVLGDFLELWQPYPGMACTAPHPDAGCTAEQTLALARRVIQAHAPDLEVIDRFVARGDNRLHVVPGNHDAALLLDPVWQTLKEALPAAGNRVRRLDDGIWLSESGMTVAEHGHQIGKDANRYDAWPQVTVEIDGAAHMIRPWGEQFVQTLFNDVEGEYPIIDNLSPESLGAKYRLADRGLGRSAQDLARFVMFNLFETSRRQRARMLSVEPGQTPEWDLDYARTRGHALVLASLGDGDEFAELIVDQSELGAAIRAQLDVEVAGLPDDHLRQLCDHAAINGRLACAPPSLAATVESTLNSKQAVVARHLRERRSRYPAMRQFVYGHTHEYETPWTATLRTGAKVEVANTGAFQRVMDAGGFERRREAMGLSASEALKGIALEDLPACYTFVVIEDEFREMELFRWHQPESAAEGRRVDAGDPVCD